MVSLLPLFAVACSFLLVHAQNYTQLITSLKNQGIAIDYSGTANYNSTRQACMSVTLHLTIASS